MSGLSGVRSFLLRSVRLFLLKSKTVKLIVTANYIKIRILLQGSIKTLFFMHLPC